MKKKNIIKGLAFLSTIGGGAYVANSFVEKTARIMMYRSVKDVLDYDSFKQEFEGQDVFIDGANDLKLHGLLIQCKRAKGTLVICHPFGHEAVEMSMYIPYFKKKLQKVNILLINAVAHGLSDGYIRGLGIKDVHDLVLWNDFIIQTYGKNHAIYFYGKECGANTILNACGLGLLKNVRCVISDGAYTSPYNILSYRLKKDYNIPNTFITSLIRRKIKKDCLIDIAYSTVDVVKNNTVPVLFFHSLQDEFVPIEHVYPLYNACGGQKELFVIKDEQYLCHVSETNEYKETLSRFLDKYL